MLPRIIHYCWFGKKELSKTGKKCIATWQSHLPNFEIKHWHEGNSPMDHPFIVAAYNAGKYAFVADYVRLYGLYHCGGIYLDSDMYVIKGFNQLLAYDCFMGMEDANTLSCGIIGCAPGNSYIKKCLDYYDVIPFDVNKLTDLSIPKIMTRVYNELNEDEKQSIKLFSPDYFYPYPYIERINGNYNFKKYSQPNTIAIHLWDASWMPEIEQYASQQRSLKTRVMKLAFRIKDILCR